MFLVPRLFGIGIYVVILLMISSYMMDRSLRMTRRLINTYWIVIGLMGYLFVPPESFDLTRLFLRMDYYTAMDVDQFWSYVSSALAPGELIYYRIIGGIENKHLLPCISGLISFAFCFGILKDHTRENRNSSREIAIALLLFMARGAIIMAISNIRTFMAFSIIGWCIYHEMVNSKSALKHGLLYLWACAMHPIGYACFAIRLMFYFLDKEKNIAKKISRFITVGIAAIVSFVILDDYLQLFITKVFGYIEEGREGTAYSYIWEGVLCAMTIATAVYLLCSINRYKRNSKCQPEEGYDSLCRFTWMIVTVDIVAGFIEFTTFLRLGYFITILLIPISLYTMRMAYQSGRYAKLRNRLYMISAGILFLACSRGYLCSLKFFE